MTASWHEVESDVHVLETNYCLLCLYRSDEDTWLLNVDLKARGRLIEKLVMTYGDLELAQEEALSILRETVQTLVDDLRGT